MVQASYDNALQSWVDPSEYIPVPVRYLGDLPGEVAIEHAEPVELRDLLVSDLDGPESAGHRAGGLRDDHRVPRASLRLTGVEVGDATHRQPRQVSDQRAACLCDGDGGAPIFAG